MECWHNICGTCSKPGHCCAVPLRKRRRESGDREGEEKEELEIYCRRVLEEEKDEGRKERIRPSHAGKSLRKKRPIIIRKRPSSDRESNRWAHHVSAWIQRLKSSPVAAAQHDKGRTSALDEDFEIGTQVPRRYFASEDDSYPVKDPIVKSDIFIFVLFQRRTFLLPKFYPKSLHFFEDDSHIPPSSIRPRRNSEPNIFSLDSSYLIHSCDKKTIFEYENRSNPSQFTSHSLLQSSRDPFISSKEKGTEGRSVKDKVKDKFSWFFQNSKKRKLDETEVNESTSILPSKSRYTLPESVRISTYSSTSSRPLLGQEILPSLPSHSITLEPGTKNEDCRQRSDSYPSKSSKSNLLAKQYSSQTSLKYLSDKENQRTETNASPKLEKLNVIEKTDTFPQSNSEDFLLNTESKTDSCETIESQNSLSLKLKSFQDNIGKLADKIKNKYLTNKPSSFITSQKESSFCDVSTFLKESEIIRVKEQGDIDSHNEEKLSGQQIININKESGSDSESSGRLSFYSNLKFDSLARRLRKMSRRRSEETENENTEEPLPKHLRSMSLPEDPRSFHRDNSYPVRPQRKKFRIKRALEIEPSDDETSVDGSPNNKYERSNLGSRRDLQFSRREFLSSMVSLSSTEEEDDEGVREKTRQKVESVLHDGKDEFKTEINMSRENSETNMDKILSPLYEISEDNYIDDSERNVNSNNLLSEVREICSGTQIEGGESLVSSQKDQFKETLLSKDTVKNEDTVEYTKHSDKYCDNLPSVIEPLCKGEVINESESYAFTSTSEVRDTRDSAKVSDVSDSSEIVNDSVNKTVYYKNDSFRENVLGYIVPKINTEVKEEEINLSEKESESKINEQFGESEGDDVSSCRSSSIAIDSSEQKNENVNLSDIFVDEKSDIEETNEKASIEISLPFSEEKNDRDSLEGNHSEQKFSDTDLEIQINICQKDSEPEKNLSDSLNSEKFDIKGKKSDKEDFIALLNYKSMTKSESQPQIFVTPADVSEKIVERKEIIKTEKAFSFAETINLASLRTDWSIPVSSGVIKGTASSVESQHGSSTIFSELESHSPSLIDNFNVSPNLSPRINSPLSGGVSDIFPATPKSPITVQEWIDSLPINVNIQSRDDETYEDEWREEPTSEPRDPSEIICTNETVSTKEEGVFLGEEAFDLNSSTSPTPLIENEKEKKSSNTKPPQSKRGPPPLTLKDIKRSVSKDESEESPVRIETPCKRTLYAETRDKQTSFQSETSILSGLSHQSVSSIESLLESRQLDPVDILLNLGFGSTEEEEGISRIPPRFLKPSKVPGNDISVFLRQEDNISDLVDSSDWAVPNLSSQVLRRNSLKSCSPLFTNLMENVREKQNRLHGRARTRSDLSSVSSNESRRFPSRFATLAKGLGKQASFARRLSAKVAQSKESANNAENVRRSVLLPENRLFLDLQGQRSPEAPKKRLIIGTDSFSLSNSGEIIDSDEESKSYKDSTCVSAKEKNLENNTQKHKDSVASVVSSTSIDSKEEAYIEELHQLTLSVTRGRESFNHSPKTLLTDKKKNLMKRLSGSSKRRSLTSQSSVSSWEMDHQIMEEEEAAHDIPIHPSIMEDKDNEEVFEEETRKRKDSIPVLAKRRKSIIRQQRVFESDKENVIPLLQDGLTNFDKGQNLEDHEMDDNGEMKSDSKESQVDSINFSSYYLNPADPTHKTVKQIKLKECDNNWSLESGKSMETVRHFPLKRNVALFSAATISENDLHSPKLQLDTPRYRLRRSSSLPDVLDSDKIFDNNEEQIKTTLDTLRRNVDCAMLAVIQTCKTQIDLQNRLSHSLSARYLLSSGGTSQFNLNYEENRQKRNSKSMRDLNSSFSSAVGDPNISVDSLTGLNRETLEVASHMKSSISSVISHLEHYLTDICPKYSSFDVSNTVGQMLWLSQHQSLLCSELERLSSVEPTGYSGSEAVHPPSLCWTSNHPFSRSMPEYLNVQNSQALVTTSNIASMPSPPIYCSSFPSLNPFSPPVTFPGVGPAKATTFTPINPSKQRVLKGQPSLSGSSGEGSFDIGGDSGAVGEWNEGKGSGVSSPYNWGQNLQTPDLIFGDFVAEKISQELEENLSGKVSKITSEVSELGHKLDRNHEDVSEIKEKLTLILNRLNMVPK